MVTSPHNSLQKFGLGWGGTNTAIISTKLVGNSGDKGFTRSKKGVVEK
jgi:hypothetical protein